MRAHTLKHWGIMWFMIEHSSWYAQISFVELLIFSVSISVSASHHHHQYNPNISYDLISLLIGVMYQKSVMYSQKYLHYIWHH
jgi:hypothetical protein